MRAKPIGRVSAGERRTRDAIDGQSGRDGTTIRTNQSLQGGSLRFANWTLKDFQAR